MSNLKKSINLLPKNELEKSPLGKFLNWALTFGRYTVIFTELVVVTAFLFRFKLDLNLAKVNSQIKKNQDIIISYKNLEDNVNQLKKRLAFIKKAEAMTLLPNELLEEMAHLTPQDVVFNEIELKSGSISFKGKSLSKIGLSTLINGLQSSDKFSQINLQSVSSKGRKSPVIKFSISAKITKK